MSRAILPLQRQNEYRARYRAMRPGWKPSGDVLEEMVRARATKDARVLDLGTGRGGVVELIWRDVSLAVGVDPDSASLAQHRAAGLPVVQALGEHLPFADDTFDLVVSVWVLEHLADPAETFREVGRVLRPGGHFLFLTPNLRHPVMALNRIGKAAPALQRRLVSRFYGRVEADTFRVRYRANTPRAIRRLAALARFEVADLRAIRDPTYVALNDAMFRASAFADGVMPESWGIHLVGDLHSVAE